MFSSRSRLDATSSLIWNAAAITPVSREPPSRTGIATTWYSFPPESQVPSVCAPWSAPAIVGTFERSAE